MNFDFVEKFHEEKFEEIKEVRKKITDDLKYMLGYFDELLKQINHSLNIEKDKIEIKDKEKLDHAINSCYCVAASIITKRLDNIYINFTDYSRDILIKKNLKYKDAYAIWGQIGIIKDILHKIKRCMSLIEEGEDGEDSFLDLANYSILYFEQG